jgi:hypothetical protein
MCYVFGIRVSSVFYYFIINMFISKRAELIIAQMLNIMKPEMMRRLDQRIEDKVKLNALERRLFSLKTIPEAGTSAHSTLDQLITRLEALRGKGGDSGAAGGAGKGPSGSAGGARRRRRTMRRSRR